MSTGIRLLVTGSRAYPANRADVVLRVFTPYLKGVTPETSHLFVLRHGAEPGKWKDGKLVTGFDALASSLWMKLGGVCDPMKADWAKWGRAAGPFRNQDMTTIEPFQDECLGFPWFADGAKSKGTLHCMGCAHAANIPTYRVRADGTKERYTGQSFDMSSLWEAESGNDPSALR